MSEEILNLFLWPGDKRNPDWMVDRGVFGLLISMTFYNEQLLTIEWFGVYNIAAPDVLKRHCSEVYRQLTQF